MASTKVYHRLNKRIFNLSVIPVRSIKTLFYHPRKSRCEDFCKLGSQYVFTSLRRPSYEALFHEYSSRRKFYKEAARSTTASSIYPSTWKPPSSGILSSLPASWLPYAELMRVDKPTGTYYLFFPCIFSSLLAASIEVPHPLPTSVLGTSVLFLAGAFIMRGAGCSINDLWDRNLDTKVARTRLRPIARGALTPFKAFIFTGAQLLTGLSILLQFPHQCLFYGIPSLLLVATYPLAKRLTNYPQVVLGLTFSWGAIMGFPALGVDLWNNSTALETAILLYLSNIAWTVLYDMIYAHMDVRDDAKAGIKSIVLRHEKHTKQILSGLAIAQVGLLATAGLVSGSGPLYFIVSCGGTALSLTTMIKKVDLNNPRDCWWWFVNGCWITGGAISSGMAIDYLIKFWQNKQEKLGND
ncbi:4-hydroxybenzoate polyprenyltransferase, mitochondrial [Erysiphe neolycopersici]|uniref:4-hydroxybenzoate polyprenyltransferase, mitochondrial n=1 Tax=Erysiphe neolycopersici TaxID=212602 RepID=A0A420HVU9_9PEZI|nr:4-hydroxybenzoate polyprenyltransferase, mitochondrial [Erysiphe neolycopersici]